MAAKVKGVDLDQLCCFNKISEPVIKSTSMYCQLKIFKLIVQISSTVVHYITSICYIHLLLITIKKINCRDVINSPFKKKTKKNKKTVLYV